MSLKLIQKQILDSMFYERRYMTVREISELAGVSWQTADAHLKKLLSKKFVEKKIEKGEDASERIKYQFNYEHYKKLKKKK